MLPMTDHEEGGGGLLLGVPYKNQLFPVCSKDLLVRHRIPGTNSSKYSMASIPSIVHFRYSQPILGSIVYFIYLEVSNTSDTWGFS